MNSHLISQVLLRRFTTNNLLRVNNKINLSSELKSPSKIGYIELPDIEFKNIEAKWSNTERKVTEAFRKLDSGVILESRKDIETIKKLMGIHYLRSKAYFRILSKTEPESYKKLIKELTERPSSNEAELRDNVHIIRNKWINDLKGLVVQSLRSISRKVDTYISQYDIEIGYIPSDVSFILSDNPAINASSDGRMGILSGLTIDQSDSFIMPLGPKHIAALITHNITTNYRIMSNEDVGIINSKSIRQSISEYYSLP